MAGLFLLYVSLSAAYVQMGAAIDKDGQFLSASLHCEARVGDGRDRSTGFPILRLCGRRYRQHAYDRCCDAKDC
jgi:hypothetical protein